MAKKNVNVDANVNIKQTGADAFKSATKGIGAGLTAGLATAVLEGKKLKAVWEGIKWTVLARAGAAGFGLLATAGLGLLGVMRKLTKESALYREGIKQASDIEMRTTQFDPLLKGAALARQRLEELVTFAARTPFQLPAIAEASRQLEVLGRGGLSSIKTLQMVGDAAAIAGRPMEDVAFWVGRLYDGIQSGRPVGEAATRLQEMGLITGQLRGRIEDVQKAGGDMNLMWAEVQKELNKTEGGMEKLSETLGGLETTLADTKAQLAQKMGEPFLDREKESVKTSIEVLQNLAPVVEDTSNYLADLFGGVEKVWNSVKKFVSGFSPLHVLFSLLIRIPLPAAMLGLAMAMGKVIAMILRGTMAMKRHSATTALMYKGYGRLALVTRVLARGMAALSRAFLRFLASPFGILIIAAAAVSKLYSAQKKLAEIQKEGLKATEEIVSELEKQQRAVRSTTDAIDVYRKSLGEVVKARTELAQLKITRQDEFDRKGFIGRIFGLGNLRENLAQQEILRRRIEELSAAAETSQQLAERGGLRESRPKEEFRREQRTLGRELEKIKEGVAIESAIRSERKMDLINRRIASRQARLQKASRIQQEGLEWPEKYANQASLIAAQTDDVVARLGMLKAAANAIDSRAVKRLNDEIKDMAGAPAIQILGKKLQGYATIINKEGARGTAVAAGPDAGKRRMFGGRSFTESQEILEELKVTYKALIANEEELAEARRESNSEAKQYEQFVKDIESQLGAEARGFFSPQTEEQFKFIEKLQEGGLDIKRKGDTFFMDPEILGRAKMELEELNKLAKERGDLEKEVVNLMAEQQKVLRQIEMAKKDQEFANRALDIERARAQVQQLILQGAWEEAHNRREQVRAEEKLLELDRMRESMKRRGFSDEEINRSLKKKQDLEEKGERVAMERYRRQAELENAATEARRKGDIFGAKSFEDFAEYERLRQQGLDANLGNEESRFLAMRAMRNRIEDEAARQFNVTGSFLRGVGGGGRAVGTDPARLAAERLKNLDKTVKDILNRMNSGETWKSPDIYLD